MKRSLWQALLCLTILHIAGCGSVREIEGLPPVVFTDTSLVPAVLGTVGIVREAPDISTATLSSSQLFRKEVWNKIVQGTLSGIKWFDQEIQPMRIVAIGCMDSKKQCRVAQIIVGSLALVSMAVGGVAGGLQAEYSDTLVDEMKESLRQEVRNLNDHLQSTVVSAANARLFERLYSGNRSGDWAKQVFAGLEVKQFIEIHTGRDGTPTEGDQVETSGESVVQSILESTVSKVHFTDDEAWLSSKIELRVEATTRITQAADGQIIAQGRHECVSVPRSIRFWSMDSYKHVREEITSCTHLLGSQIANELVDGSTRNVSNGRIR